MSPKLLKQLEKCLKTRHFSSGFKIPQSGIMEVSMRRILPISIMVVLSLFLNACGYYFEGSRLGNDSGLVMEYKMLNKTDSQDLTVEAGDIIHAEIEVEGGQLTLKIQKGDELPVYESAGVKSSDIFDIEIKESGIYTVTVTGKRAKGSVSFTVESE